MKKLSSMLFGLMMIVMVIFSGCSNINHGEIKLEFTAKECDEEIDPYNEEGLGIQEITWLDDETVQVVVHVSINCAEEIQGGMIKEIEDGKVKLVYVAPDCSESGNCMRCMCGHKLVYTFNLGAGEYDFSIERENASITTLNHEPCGTCPV